MTLDKKIILDCDPGEDDALAILLALSKGLPIAGLICGFGNTSARKTYLNGAGLLTLAKRTDVPIFMGATKPYLPHPLEKEIVSAGDFVGENGLCGLELPPIPDFLVMKDKASQEERIKNIIVHLKSFAPVTYIVTGPCTTLSHVLDGLGRDASKIIDQIIIMGGALDAAGNTGPINPKTNKPFAEFNFYCDPHAAQNVLDTDIPITLVPWDLTEKIVMTHDERKSWHSNTPQGSFVLHLMKNFLESYGNAHERSFEFNDCITITAFEGAGDFRDEQVRVILEGQQTGRLIRDNINGKTLKLFDLRPDKINPTRDKILNTLGIQKI